MKPPWGQSSRLLPTLDTGEDLVGLLKMTHRWTTVGGNVTFNIKKFISHTDIRFNSCLSLLSLEKLTQLVGTCSEHELCLANKQFQFVHFTAETNIPDEFSPLIHKKQRDYVKNICFLERQSGEELFTRRPHISCTKLIPHSSHVRWSHY